MSVTKYVTPKGAKRWRARVWDPTKGPKGGWRHLGNRDTKGAALALIDADRDEQRKPTPQTITVNEWRELWLSTSSVTDSTRMWHEDRTKAFADAHGDDTLADIGRPLALEWAARHPSQAQGLSAMWTAAVDARLAVDHPWRGLVRRRGSQIEPGWLVRQDIEQILTAAVAVHGPIYGRHMAAMLTVGAYSGLRPGELAGLRWIDLDPVDGLLHVRQQANSAVKRMAPPKGGLTRAVVYADVAQAAVAGMPRLHDDLVFVSKRGRVLFNAQRSYIWSPVRAFVGRPTMRLHELRHYAATMLLEHGVSDSDVATQLGHTDGGRLVRSTYGHPRQDPALQRVRAALEAATTPDTEEAAS